MTRVKRTLGFLVAVAARLWRLLLQWVHFLFFILHTQPPFQSISFVLSCCQEESSPLKVSNNNKGAFLAFVLCPGHSDETSHSNNLFVCSFICDLPLETKDLNTCGIIQRLHLWFESSLYVTVLCNFFHKKRSSGFHSYPWYTTRTHESVCQWVLSFSTVFMSLDDNNWQQIDSLEAFCSIYWKAEELLWWNFSNWTCALCWVNAHGCRHS